MNNFLKYIAGFFAILVTAGFFAGLTLVSGCRTNALDRKVVESQKLRKEVAVLASKNRHLMEENQHLKSRVNALEIAFSDLSPESPPLYRAGDVKEGAIRIRRLYSSWSGSCFDHEGLPRCFFFEVPPEHGGGYLVYQSNRRFAVADQDLALVSENGRDLHVLTRDFAKIIQKWEMENPDKPIQLSFY